MIGEIQRKKSPAEAHAFEGTWIQITFTLDAEHYRALWERAEAEHRTIPAFVRETVTEALIETQREAVLAPAVSD
jgi:hypothetical protein